MKRVPLALVTLLALVAFPVFAGEWHAGATNVCTDCHTMHFSQTHNWDGTTPVSTTPQPNGNWLSTTGPNVYLLKAPANQLCLACHDGQTFAPDVVGLNTNASPSQGRNAGALNETVLGAPYEDWKGHTLDSTNVPPGYNPTSAGLAADFYDNTAGLECISCHLQHGSATVYRNLGPRNAAFQPTYAFATTNDTTKDVWINYDKTLYTPNTGNAATFNPLYASANVSYNRTDPASATGATTQSSNRMDTFCSACHGQFHGSPGDATVGGNAATIGFEHFIRHPTSRTTLANGSGHSQLSRYVANTTKTKVYANDRTAWTDASPGCVSCHKAHGNQNPFGLVFLARAAATVDEQGGFGATQTPSQAVGYRNLCGQCHSQGADSTSGTQPN
jgi:cytochrome c553